ncbi:hypothetical protein BZG36_01401 [Bifiguratus adelaidae]|uniref:Enhancer of mRNA-decapping protein 3 n=1 Tax=Bifiguratus adelaidae TaxID=1938954 RepID=A0A261Y3C4_9FUNG|nr:hypothetical protein BZG36_01401 [Bifiguratus adelaidae]
MASAFLGLTVKVVLKDGCLAYGRVAHINEERQILTLGDAWIDSVDKSGYPVPEYTIDASNISDLQITDSGPKKQHRTTNGKTHTPEPYQDPAIVSISHPGKSQGSLSDEGARKKHVNVPANAVSGDTVEVDYSALANMHLGDGTVDSSAAEDGVDRYYAKKGKGRRAKLATNYSDYEHESQKFSSKKLSRRNKERLAANHTWAGEDVNDFKEEEFDFEANLSLFDKEKVFAEIRESDTTAPESLLVSHNRAPARKPASRVTESTPVDRAGRPVNYAPTEMVLERSINAYNVHEEAEEDEVDDSFPTSQRRQSLPKQERGRRVDDLIDGALESDDSWTMPDRIRNGVSPSGRLESRPIARQVSNSGLSPATASRINYEANRKRTKIRTVTGGIRCPCATPLQMVEVERICASEIGPNDDQLIENAGRGASLMAIQAVGGPRRIQPQNHNAAPLVVVLAGNNKFGSYGLCTARHLANHGCQVIVCMVGRESEALKSVNYQEKIFGYTGGVVVRNTDDLPDPFTTPVDLIIDAILGYQYSFRDLPDDENNKGLVLDMIEWANSNKAPVLSLDFPSGLNGETGLPHHAPHYMHPKWTLSLGAPKTGCRSRNITGELFLADIGIPKCTWRKVGLKGWGIPWGSEFVIAVEYV